MSAAEPFARVWDAMTSANDSFVVVLDDATTGIGHFFAISPSSVSSFFVFRSETAGRGDDDFSVCSFLVETRSEDDEPDRFVRSNHRIAYLPKADLYKFAVDDVDDGADCSAPQFLLEAVVHAIDGS